jgi:hypothetical protein
MRWLGAYSTHGAEKKYKLGTRKPEGARSLERPKRSLEDNVKMDLSEKLWGGMHWINLTYDRDQRRALLKTVITIGVT